MKMIVIPKEYGSVVTVYVRNHTYVLRAGECVSVPDEVPPPERDPGEITGGE